MMIGARNLKIAKKIISHGVVFGLATIAAYTLTACSFEGGRPFNGSPINLHDGRTDPEEVNAIWESSSLTLPAKKARGFIYGDPGRIQVYHGASCAFADSALSSDNAHNDLVGIRVEEHASIPAGYDAATVFLNGWRLRYEDGDHEVQGLGTAIFDIEQDQQELRWKAGGILSDKNGDDGYEWCYYYTILFWNSHPLDLDAVPVDSDNGAELTFVFPDGFDGETTALRRLSAHISDEVDVPRALLPRGFGVMRTGKDRHLLQFALKFGDVDVAAMENGSGGHMLWQFQTILKDNSTRHAYIATELVSTLNGESVRVRQPPFTISPQSRTDCPNIGSPSFREETFIVEDVQFDYAVPMLTGWDIGDVCSDHNIKDIGVWIASFDYEKAPGATTGTLTYTVQSVFTDKRGTFGSNGMKEPGYQVSILGLNSRGIVLPSPTTPPVLENPNPGGPQLPRLPNGPVTRRE